MRLICGVMILATALAACSRDVNVYEFDGVVFKANARKDGDSKAQFTATASPASESVSGALQSAEYQGIRYCVNNFGTSDIEWSFGPDQDPETYVPENDTVVLSGTCIE